jgi:hypothetical protein
VGDARGDAARAVHERLDWSPWEDGAWWFVAPFLISQLGHGIITAVSVPSRMLREHYAIMLGWIVASSAVADRGGGPRPQRSVAQDARSNLSGVSVQARASRPAGGVGEARRRGAQ